MDSLEGRVVLSVAFDSVLGVGNDVASVYPEDNAVDASGNTYVTGRFVQTVDFDPLVDRPDGSDVLTARGNTDAFVAKYAPDNTLVWARQMGSDLDTRAFYTSEGGEGISVDSAGNVYVSGGFLGQADFGPFRLTSAGDKDVYVAKLNASGVFLWAKGWGGTTRDFSGGIAVDGSGNVVSVGSTATVFSNGSFTLNGFEVRKYGPTGASMWNARIDGTGAEAVGVATGADGSVYVGGGFRGTVDFNPAPRKTNYASGASNAANGYVLKLTSAGAFGWVSPFVAKTLEVPGSFTYCTDLAVDAAGSVVVGGPYNGQVDFNPSTKGDYRLPTGSGSNSFVTKLSSSGSLVWANRLGGTVLQSVAVDSTGSVYVAGYFAESFDPGFGRPVVTSNGNAQGFVTKYTAAGTLDWAETFGGPGSEVVRAICVDASGSIYLAGYFQEDPANPGAADFDPDPVAAHELSNASLFDMFLLKLRKRVQ